MLAVPACAALLRAASSSTRVLNCSRPAASALRRAAVATCAFHQSDRVDSVPVQRRFDTAPARMPPRRRLGALCAAPSKGLGAVRARSPRRAARLQNAFVFTLFVAWSEFRVPARAPELASLAEQKAGSHSLDCSRCAGGLSDAAQRSGAPATALVYAAAARYREIRARGAVGASTQPWKGSKLSSAAC